MKPCPSCGMFNCQGGISCVTYGQAIADTDKYLKGYTEMNQVTHPNHYTIGKIEVIDFIVDQKLSYALGNAIKYICRCNHKGHKVVDLQKAIQYLKFEIEKNCGPEDWK